VSLGFGGERTSIGGRISSCGASADLLADRVRRQDRASEQRIRCQQKADQQRDGGKSENGPNLAQHH